ncbi:hypothetical protein AD935_04100 [Gluconobacter japonicus]|nr:hypothetical protein AD935_04100 [Gluconobacter japonicus]
MEPPGEATASGQAYALVALFPLGQSGGYPQSRNFHPNVTASLAPVAVLGQLGTLEAHHE